MQNSVTSEKHEMIKRRYSPVVSMLRGKCGELVLHSKLSRLLGTFSTAQ